MDLGLSCNGIVLVEWVVVFECVVVLEVVGGIWVWGIFSYFLNILDFDDVW